MTSQTLLFITDKDTSDATLSAVADTAYDTSSHLTCLLLGTMPHLPVSIYGAMPYVGAVATEDWPRLMQQAQGDLQNRVTHATEVLTRNGVPGDVQPALCATADIQRAVSRRAMTSDIAHIAPNLRKSDDVFQQAVQGVLFQSPIGVLLNTDGLVAPKRVFLAWDDGLSAARAAHMALPMLQAATEVTVGCFDLSSAQGPNHKDPGVDVATWLSHQGCNVTVTQYPTGGQEIGTCIQDRAAEIGADLIVMGAYGHSRLRETVFGGTTRTMLAQTDMPVFLAH